MATVTQQLHPTSWASPTSNFSYLVFNPGSTGPIPALRFDPDTDWAAFNSFRAVSYGSGNLTVDIDWYANTASASNVVWGIQIACVTPNTDTDDMETKSFATANTVQDTHLGTTGKRLHRASVTVSNTDSIAADDFVMIRLYRDANGTAATDDMSGYADVVMVTVSYSDT